MHASWTINLQNPLHNYRHFQLLKNFLGIIWIWKKGGFFLNVLSLLNYNALIFMASLTFFDILINEKFDIDFSVFKVIE